MLSHRSQLIDHAFCRWGNQHKLIQEIRKAKRTKRMRTKHNVGSYLFHKSTVGLSFHVTCFGASVGLGTILYCLLKSSPFLFGRYIIVKSVL